MADTNTTNLSLVKPGVKDEAGAGLWAEKLNANFDLIDAALISHNFAEDCENHSGLDFAYKAGVTARGTTVTATAAGAVTLTDDATNYIEVNPADGTVSANTTGFTAGRIPLYTAIAAAGAITTVTDKRALMRVEAPKVRGIAFYIDGILAVETQAMSFVSPLAITVSEVRLSVDVAPVGSDLIVDIHKNGVTMFTTQANRPTITAGNTSATSAAPDITSIDVGDLITIEIDQVGSSVAGSNLAATVRGTEAA